MNQMEGYKELLDQLNGLVKSLESGELSLDELSDLETVTRKLHERSIILRYKAFEATVKGEVPVEEESVEPVVVESTPEPEPEVEEEKQEETEEESSFDFDIFDADEKEESTEVEPEVVEETVAEPEVVTPEVASPEPVATPEPVAEDIEEPENIPAAEPVEEASTVANSGNSFLDKLAQQDNSLGSRFSAGPLDSLIGAFGLNERLRFINDLFDGSSEKFSDAIKALDTQDDLDNARYKAAGYAQENEWDPEEEVVVEFMNYLNRRYA